MLKRPLKGLLFSGVGAIGLGLVTWVSISVIAKQQTAEMTEIATEFFQQYPPIEQNTSADTLDKLVAELGLALHTHQDTSPDETADFQTIAETVQAYFSDQQLKTKGPLDPIPATVQTYLNNNQATLTQIQTHLKSQDAPVWNFDIEHYTDLDHAPPLDLGLINLHKLLLLKASAHAQQKQWEQMFSALEASQLLIDIPMQRPDLISYVVSLIAMDGAATILRHLENVPPSVSEQRLAVDQQQLSVDRLRFENWTFYQSLNLSLNDPQSESLFDNTDSGLAMLPTIILGKPYLKLSSNNTVRLREKSHEQMMNANICALDLDTLEESLLEEIPWWNVIGQVSIPSFSSQWRKGGDRMLDAELTHLVVQAKALATEQGQWPETLPNLTSQTCPGEQWIYEVSPAGEMSLSFSHDFDWHANHNDAPVRYIPLTYSANLPDS